MNYQLGIVIPVYRSTLSVLELLQEMALLLPPLRYHVYLVDDSGSPCQRDWLAQHCLNPQVTLLVLRQNSGQQNAVLCGLREALKECETLATMDDDRQHPVALLPHMYRQLTEGYELVYAIGEGDERATHRRLGSRLRDLLFHRMLSVPEGVRVSSYRIMSHKLAAEATQHDYRFYYFTASALCRPRRIGNLLYPTVPRPYGRSGYSLGRLCGLFFGILRTYTGIGRRVLRPPTGMGYEVAAILKGDEPS
ncbi:MAG: glycosyltransferase [Angelakisella sp.]